MAFFSEEENNLVLIDFNNTLMRSMAVNKDLSHKGRPTGGFYGFVMQLTSVINFAKPKHIVVCDDKRPYFRETEYKEYKSDREVTEDSEGFFEALAYNKGKCKEFLELLNIPIMSKVGFEADDWIALLAKKYAGDFDKIIVISNDSDLFQLFNISGLCFYKRDAKAKKMYLYDRKKFDEEYFPVVPETFNFYTAMVGSHNNFPGIKGIGDKTAKKILSDPTKWKEIFTKNKVHFEKASKILPLPHVLALDNFEDEILIKHEAKETAIDRLLISQGITIRNTMSQAFQFYR